MHHDVPATTTKPQKLSAYFARDVVRRRTATIARNSHADPREIDQFQDGGTVDAATHRAAERSLRAFLS